MENIDVKELAYSNFETFKKVIDSLPDEKVSDLEVTNWTIRDGEKIEWSTPILHWLANFSYSDYDTATPPMSSNKKIEYLLQRGYDVDKLDNHGLTALAYARHSGNLTTMILLLQHKANPLNKYPQKGRENQTIYDSLFDKKGNYADFAYQKHDPVRSEVGSPEYKESTRKLEEHLQTIRALCKPEFEGKRIFPQIDTNVNLGKGGR